jgi:hypothetical protein
MIHADTAQIFAVNWDTHTMRLRLDRDVREGRWKNVDGTKRGFEWGWRNMSRQSAQWRPVGFDDWYYMRIRYMSFREIRYMGKVELKRTLFLFCSSTVTIDTWQCAKLEFLYVKLSLSE